MKLKKGDFIEIEFTGRTLNDGKVFDSNIKEDLEKLHQGHSHSIKPKPFIFSLGQGMFLEGVDDFLIGREIGEYKIPLPPEKAFGRREPGLIQRVPMRIFKEQKINPFPGAIFNFDGRVGRILAVSGGRVLTDFNNPLAGKEIIYEVKVLRKVDDINEKVKAFNEFLFKKDLKFKIEDKTLFLQVEKPLVKFAEIFKDKYKEVFSLDLEVREFDKKLKEETQEKKA